MVRLLVLLAVLGLIYVSDSLIDAHYEVVKAQITSHEHAASLMSYESTTPVHLLHHIETLLLVALLVVACAALFPPLTRGEFLNMVWATGLSVLLLLGLLTIFFEGVTAGAEQQWSFSTSLTTSEFPPMFLDLLAVFSCVGMFFISPASD